MEATFVSLIAWGQGPRVSVVSRSGWRRCPDSIARQSRRTGTGSGSFLFEHGGRCVQLPGAPRLQGEVSIPNGRPLLTWSIRAGSGCRASWADVSALVAGG
jgi:hypothetical protein